MKFLYPEFLWAFALLIIPIVIHLFNFKRYKNLYFSSLTFVKHVDQNTKSVQRLKHLLILLARLLAFIFIVLAFSQPYFSDNQQEASKENPCTMFYIDNSFSMQAKGTEGELLSQARETARKIIEKSPLNSQFIIGTNEFNGTEERLLSKIEALDRLDQIGFSPMQRSLSEIINWQSNLLKTKSLQQVNSKSILLSDFQKSTDESISEVKLATSFYPIKFTPETTSNIYIDSVWFSSTIHKVNAPNELNIEAVNASDQLLTNVEINIAIGDYSKTIYIDLEKNESKTVQVGYTDRTSGVKSGHVHIVDENILFDDFYYLSYEVKEYSNISILNGPDAIPNFSLVYSLDNFYHVEENDLLSISSDNLENKDLIIINGANSISNGLITLFTDYVKTGGSIGLFPGSTPNKSEWNQLLQAFHLPQFGGDITSGTKIKQLNYADPFFANVFEKKTTNLNLPSVNRSFEPKKIGHLNYRDIITLNNGLSLFSASKPNGNVFAFYSSLTSSFGNLPKDALFTALSLRMAETSQKNAPLYSIIGNESKHPIYANIPNDETIHITDESIDIIPETQIISGTRYLILKRLQDVRNFNASNYKLGTETGLDLGILSMNYNRSESNLSSYTQGEIENILRSNGINNIEFKEINNSTSYSTISIDKPSSFWKICILLALVFLALEMVIIRFIN